MAVVGGRRFDADAGEVRRKMAGVAPEPIREHYTDVDGVTYPPKQIIAVVTGWRRTSYTTMEAQRVLAQLGFRSYRLDERPIQPATGPKADSNVDRLAKLEASVLVLQEAVAFLSARMSALEGP